MKVYITVIPEGDDLRFFNPTRESDPGKKLGAIMTFTGIMMRDKIPTRLVITNMKRERPTQFVKASEM